MIFHLCDLPNVPSAISRAIRLSLRVLYRDAFKDAKTEEDAAVIAGKLAKAKLDLGMLERQATIGISLIV